MKELSFNQMESIEGGGKACAYGLLAVGIGMSALAAVATGGFSLGWQLAASAGVSAVYGAISNEVC